ncbi:MAG TPA: hypothetical protein VIM68_11300 [Thermoanaerobaculia bacterium]
MRRFTILIAVVLAAACGNEKTRTSTVSKEPVSVRGWIDDVQGSVKSTTPELETARRSQIFQATQIWVENADYVSGGVAENGAFILLDVPPGNVTIGLSAPGAEHARLVLQNIPGTADVFIPAVVLEPNGATVVNPRDVKVRVAAEVANPTPTGKTAIVAGVSVPILNVPLSAMVDRHDYPRPTGFQPVATFK